VPFTTKLRVEEVEGAGDSWRLVEPLVYHGMKDVVIIPADFITDFGSVPSGLRWLVPAYGRGKKAYVLHDWLYKTQELVRKDADGIMRRVLRELGMSRVRRWSAWAGVRIGGWLPWKRAVESKK